MKKLLHDFFFGSKNDKKLSPGPSSPVDRVEEYTFVLRFLAVEEKKILNSLAITLLSATISPLIMNDALILAFDFPLSSLISFQVFFMSPSTFSNFL